MINVVGWEHKIRYLGNDKIYCCVDALEKDVDLASEPLPIIIQDVRELKLKE